MDGATETVHATAIALDGRAVLIRGPSGSGKSDLALRCLAIAPSALLANAARLIADDRVVITRSGLTLVASAPPAIAGKLEIRGVGIVTIDAAVSGEVVMIADIVPAASIERLPDPWPYAKLLGVEIPILNIEAFDASTPVKILIALSQRAMPPPRLCQ